ncbi:MAG: efflux RND transporter periplasmic adaptor subunit [Lachnospiraceae bacterium]|nr:efflux RND transporter periplasmic adaptor subunit [Candidatus Colinaster equi]
MKEKITTILRSKRNKALIGGVLVAVLAIGAVSISANAATKVNSYKADIGALASTMELNGKVESDSEKIYFSKVDGIVGAIQVKEGDFVKKDDIILTYDAEEIARLTAIAEYGAEAELGSYNNSIQTGNRTAGLYGEATRNLGVLNQQIEATQITLTQKQNELAERRAALADEGAKLQISLIEWSDEPDSEEYENLQKLIQSNAYEQQYASDIMDMEKEINDLNIALAGFKEDKAQMLSQKAATQMGLMTDGAKEQLEAVKAANELSSNEVISNYKNAAEGVKAEFDGIVTAINVTSGSGVATGEQLFTIKSISDVVVKLNVNKYDIVNIEEGQKATVTIKNKQYDGKVVRISRVADELESGGIAVEVKLDKPDSDIILGIETKAIIETANLTEALVVPMAALWEDEEGTFLFVEKNGKAVKTKVETGVRNEEQVEILSGITAGDVVVWNDASEIRDGMSVRIG